LVQRATDSLEPWNISEDEFPKEGLMYDKLKFFLRYAILAPSIHNTQPWAFRISSNNIIELYADKKRSLPVLDPIGRQLIISCGTALGYLQVTISHFGYKYKTELLPTTNDGKQNHKHLLAKIGIDSNSSNSFNDNNDKIQECNNIKVNSLQKEDNDRLFEAIPKRGTNRFKFDDRNIPDILVAGFYYIIKKYPQYQEQQEQQEDPIWLHIADEIDNKNALAELVARGSHILYSDKHFTRELIKWTSLNKSGGGNRGSMSRHAFGITNFISKVNPYLQISRKQEGKDYRLAATSSALAILGTYSDGQLDWINTGLALTNILLLARSENVSCSFLNQPIQVPNLRPKLLDVIRKEKGFPQILLGMGYSRHEIEPSPRRGIEEVLLH
jgi:hypothetical protein